MRTARIRPLLPVLALLLAAGPGACAGGPGPARDLSTIRGIVRVVGNEPFTHVVVTVPGEAAEPGSRIDYQILGPLAGELRAHHQGRTVVLEGKEVPPAAPRFRRGFEPSRIAGP